MVIGSTLERLSDVQTHSFLAPVKKIHDGQDVSFFLTSLGYRDIVTFILQLSRAVVPRQVTREGTATSQTFLLNDERIILSQAVQNVRQLIRLLESRIKDVPPDTGPRRFGNISFRKWYTLVEDQISDLLKDTLSLDAVPAVEELKAYLLGSFGSPQRLDYGTGHELSFLAFLGCLWKINYFDTTNSAQEERGIVLGIFEQYLNLIRSLIKTYTLEPAGSHGVWGLDDNSFLPYVFGSAQLSPAITEDDETPTEGSITNAPEPSSVTKLNIVEKERSSNMYFSAIAFIYDVKKGPFWEHSPVLYDISGIKDGWGKINKGMTKMYNAEVLSKFPVVQHFPFGSLFRWERDPAAKAPPPSTHTNSQPLRNAAATNAPSLARPGGPAGRGVGAAAPWASRPPPPAAGFVNGVTKAPWASRTPAPPPPRGGFQAPLRRPAPTIPERPGPPEKEARS